MYRLIYSDTLSHHGILGMKWGKRNGPPYPLDAGDHSASERKAGWRKSLKEKKAAKEERKHWKQEYNSILNKSLDYGEEYDATTEGKQKLKAYQKAIRELESTDWDSKPDKAQSDFYNRFYKTEYDYLSSQGEFEARKLLSEYSLEYLQEAEKKGAWSYSPSLVGAKTADDYVKLYGKQSAYVHSY